jgi:hypothetical protein
MGYDLLPYNILHKNPPPQDRCIVTIASGRPASKKNSLRCIAIRRDAKPKIPK